ncbi:outer membrane biogenesis protein BamB [Rosistilla carotiformis]|uniref:Outer membrane biogenesis protein BamB n=1 Tax=Rosistilla carotiformis TaxID=2528017 RepID=A0A518K0Q8_9BACT|nr:PQQ-binding-like beta-propeller repeat protein [Rosistilla carotiformis]QDV71386.1 outer membrane biogenesis protein BamB [Rosistilla carotiformis]
MSQSVLARELIALIERRGLLDQEIVDALNQQMEEGGARVTPEAVAKLLVDNGHLTRYQATKLIGELRSDQYQEDEPEPVEVAEEPELLLDEGEHPLEIEAIEVEAVEVEPIEADVVDAEMVDAEAVEVEAIDDQGLADKPKRSTSGSRRTTKRKTSKKEPEKSVWDSFKIYGVAGAILACLPLGWFFWNYINKGNAAEYMERANNFYAQENYTGAKQTYLDYLDSFGEETEDSSKARVRIAMAQLYQTMQNSTDPEKFLTTASTLLPTVINEQALGENRADLAGLLVEVAEKFVSQADKTVDADEKEKIIGHLDQQMELIAEPSYVSTELRESLGKRLAIIEEDRLRVNRDISRDRKLADTIATMKQALEAKDTKTAYAARKQIIREYPRLHDEAQMNALVVEASKLQQELVKTGVAELKVSNDELETKIRKSIVLANQSGRTLNELGDLVYFVRVGGSVQALKASDGSLLWRRFVGYRDEHPPTALGETPEDGVLLSDGSQLEVQRLSGSDGKLQWRAAIGETFTQPVVADDTINFSTHSGKVASLDAETGKTLWVSQIPQALEVSPGTENKKGLAVSYVPGDHSNLYVLDHRTGNCIESYYVGHQEKSIRVPPMYLLNHVFVFENRSSDYCLMHVLQTDKRGHELKQSQTSFRLTGNVLVDPQIEGRRLIVVTNLGQISVFEVEPTAETNKVSKVAEQVPSYSEPTLTQMTIDRSQMWVTGSQIMRFDLQINTGRVIPGEVKYAGDIFSAQPKLVGNALIHARVVSGTKGIRVSAVEPKTMEVFWQTDLGVPTAFVAKHGSALHAATSQGALYEIDAASIASGATKKPVENPGGQGHGIQFVSPISFGENTKIMVNQTKPDQIAVYDPSREKQKLRLVKLALPDGRPTADPLVVGKGLLMPQDSGRIAMMDWQSGRMLSNPFQPSLKPNEKVTWTSLASLPSDPEQVIFGDNRKKLYRVRAGDQIRQLSDSDVERPLLGPLTIVGDQVLAIAAGPSADMLLTFDANSLKAGTELLLAGRVTWGPKAIDSVAVVATDNQKLTAYDSTGKAAWQIDLPAGNPVGDPVLADGSLLIAGEQGWVLRIDPSSGELQGTTDIGQPLSGTPIVFGSVVVAPGAEGIVFAIDPPANAN